MVATCACIVLSALVVTLKTASSVVSCLWTEAIAISNSSNSSLVEDASDPYITLVSSAIFCAAVSALSFFMLCAFRPLSKTYSEMERAFRKSVFAIIGLCVCISVAMTKFSVHSNRSSAAVLALFTCFAVPIQFVVRALITGRKSTRRKYICACVVVSAQLLCLMPQIFPQLEGEGESQSNLEDIESILLWPLTFLIAMIPAAVAIAFSEKNLQTMAPKPGNHGSAFDLTQLNFAFFLFGTATSTLCFVAAFFWLDLLPGYGTCNGHIHIFIHKARQHFGCLFAQQYCAPKVQAIAWTSMAVNGALAASGAFLLRHSEGANYLALVLCFEWPLRSIFWSLFHQGGSLLQWYPDPSMSTWLSSAALILMLPSAVVYLTGNSELSLEIERYSRHLSHVSHVSHISHVSEMEADDDEGPLLASASVYPIIVGTSQRPPHHATPSNASLDDRHWVYENSVIA